ncbi:hypothetical protein [Flavobacterium hydrophilum]|uniref:Ferredoxin n=1 Tax=Flavobacterium hydrophilum TaxID=2211445 RepID=A0A2V4BX60_9FLAO|nr:hypothetical protein [Flavobacterium hydrophilum]PXY43586.1 hypothetical protein DMB68_18540 [Flavobacterium hydrophilum]
MGIFKNIFGHRSKPTSTSTLIACRARHELNASGDFYVEKNGCTLCGAPEAEAEGLIGHSENGCYFIRQPQTEEEIEQAINAIAVSCVSAVRYGGTDQKIIKRLYELDLATECDHKLKV